MDSCPHTNALQRHGCATIPRILQVANFSARNSSGPFFVFRFFTLACLGIPTPMNQQEETPSTMLPQHNPYSSTIHTLAHLHLNSPLVTSQLVSVPENAATGRKVVHSIILKLLILFSDSARVHPPAEVCFGDFCFFFPSPDVSEFYIF